MSELTCRLCLGELRWATRGRCQDARDCKHPLTLPGADCLFGHGTLPEMIAESLLKLRRYPKRDQEAVVILLRDFFAVARIGEPVALQHLHRLTDHDRWMLIRSTAPSLRDWLLEAYRNEDLVCRPDLKSACYPELPEHLVYRLRAFEDKQKSRLDARRRNGHRRSPDSLRRLMVEPVSLAKFLAARGVDRWEAMTMTDQVAFAKTRSTFSQAKLKPFLEYLQGQRSFRPPPARSRSKSTKVIRETRRTPILMPEELELRLKDARARLNPEEYLLYWLVAKLGLTAQAARGITLDRVTINSAGRLVICPAQAWFALPKKLGRTMECLARKADAEWPYPDPAQSAKIPLLTDIAPEYRVSTHILRREAILLRSSAIHAAMCSGMLDRKTLSAMTGVSLQTISKMEFLLSADIHSLMSHEMASARNRAILGDSDE